MHGMSVEMEDSLGLLLYSITAWHYQ